MDRWREAIFVEKKVAWIHPRAWILLGCCYWAWKGRKRGNEIVVECCNFGGGKGIKGPAGLGKMRSRLVLMVSREASD